MRLQLIESLGLPISVLTVKVFEAGKEGLYDAEEYEELANTDEEDCDDAALL